MAESERSLANLTNPSPNPGVPSPMPGGPILFLRAFILLLLTIQAPIPVVPIPRQEVPTRLQVSHLLTRTTYLGAIIQAVPVLSPEGQILSQQPIP